MTKDLTTAKRKRTTKKNIVLNTVIPQCEEILCGEMNEDIIAEAVVMMKTLEEAADEVRCLDGEVGSSELRPLNFSSMPRLENTGISTRKLTRNLQEWFGSIFISMTYQREQRMQKRD